MESSTALELIEKGKVTEVFTIQTEMNKMKFILPCTAKSHRQMKKSDHFKQSSLVSLWRKSRLVLQ